MSICNVLKEFKGMMKLKQASRFKGNN